ncbi:putative Cytochrome P450 1A1 [Hypsibius exemplaris]|uniref:Cytochrome P450 1A1 n=1 Tax=Hypsibius exemplaris TaxID=2072580 RepID=A0A1W0WXM9_HYPEX|nr:putative Cytochrome P450 1A1 [Hypsibius exemplaris]
MKFQLSYAWLLVTLSCTNQIAPILTHLPLVCLIIPLIIAFAIYISNIRPFGVARGPIGLPFFGYSPFLHGTPARALHRLGRKYGGIFSVFLGRELTLILHSHAAMTAAFVANGNAFLGRRPGFYEEVLNSWRTDGKKLVTRTVGTHWQAARLFIANTIHQTGVSTANNLDLTKGALEKMFLKFDHEKTVTIAGAIDPTDFVMSAVIDVLFTVIFVQGSSVPTPAADFPLASLCPRPALPRAVDRYESTFLASLRTTFMAEIRKRQRRLSSLDETDQSFVGHYWREKWKQLASGKVDDHLTEQELLSELTCAFGAGTLGITGTIRWAFYHILGNPAVQKKIHAEMDSCGLGGAWIGVEHKAQLPYTEAFCEEVRRLGTVFPMSVVHESTEDVSILGQTVPAGTMVIANLFSVNRDPDYWPNSDTFRPERFLTTADEFSDAKHSVGFSLGPRKCPAQVFVRQEQFIFLANILNRYRLDKPPGCTTDWHHAGLGEVLLEPPTFRVVLTPRHTLAA